jgi:hypothetical protein
MVLLDGHAIHTHFIFRFKNCAHSNLNGLNYHANGTSSADDHTGIVWKGIGSGDSTAIQEVFMMIRPRNDARL